MTHLVGQTVSRTRVPGRRMRRAEVRPVFRSLSNVPWHGLHPPEEEAALSILIRAPEGLVQEL